MKPVPSAEKKLVDEILSLHSSIRYCGVIGTDGGVIEGSMKKGVDSLEPESETSKLTMQLAILTGADKGWDTYLGETDFVLFRKGKVNLFLFPVHGSKGVLVSTTPFFSMEKVDEIRSAIDAYRKV